MIDFQLPKPFTDAIHVDTVLRFGWLDRLRVLLGGQVVIEAMTMCEHRPGQVKSSVTVRIGGLRDKRYFGSDANQPWIKRPGGETTGAISEQMAVEIVNHGAVVADDAD